MKEEIQLRKGHLRELLPFLPLEKNQCKIRAHNDVEAIERWLDEYFDKATTYRSYKKEAERFLIWCVLLRKTTLTKLNRDDIEAYINFLKNPDPHWCGPKGGRKVIGDKNWYPFAGPLGVSAIKTSLAILNSLMNYLIDARYTDFNPFGLIRRKTRFKDKFALQSLAIHERIITPKEWQALIQALNDYPEDAQKKRLTFLITILFLLGLRINELATATWAQFRQINEKWWFFVHGKGDRLGKIPVNRELLHAIISYRNAQGKTALPSDSDFSPVICSLSDPNMALGTRQLTNLIKELAMKASSFFPNDTQSHLKLMRFSPHWLRHLSASAQDLAGISFTHIKQNLRHQNEQTTRQYVHAYDDERHRDMEKLKILKT